MLTLLSKCTLKPLRKALDVKTENLQPQIKQQQQLQANLRFRASQSPLSGGEKAYT